MGHFNSSWASLELEERPPRNNRVYSSEIQKAQFLTTSCGEFASTRQACTIPLVAPYRVILPYYRCDTPYCAMLFKGDQHSPKMVRYPPLVLRLTQTHLCNTPSCDISRDKCAIPHKKKSTEEFCDAIATSIARYEEYRCWAAKTIPAKIITDKFIWKSQFQFF